MGVKKFGLHKEASKQNELVQKNTRYIFNCRLFHITSLKAPFWTAALFLQSHKSNVGFVDGRGEERYECM